MTPEDYVVGHVREALVADLDLRVVAVNGRIVLSGAVPSAGRRDELLAAARAAAADVEVVSDLVVRPLIGASGAEELG